MANLHAARVLGNLTFWDSHRRRLIDAIGPDVTKYINDFEVGNSATDALAGFTVTLVEAGAGETTLTKLDASGGKIRITTDAAENDGLSMQLAGENFILKSTNHVYFYAKGVTVSHATESDFFVGLANTDTTILGGVNSRIGFEKLDGVTDIKAMLEAATTETLTASLATLVAATAVDLEFYWDGASVTFFIDGVAVATPAVTNVPIEELCLSVEFLTGSANARTMDIDKLVCIQIGR